MLCNHVRHILGPSKLRLPPYFSLPKGAGRDEANVWIVVPIAEPIGPMRLPLTSHSRFFFSLLIFITS